MPANDADNGAGSDLVLVEVNGKTLRESELRDRVEAMLAQQQGEIPPGERGGVMAQLRANAIRDFITQVLLEDEANARGIRPSEEDLRKAMADVAGRLPPGQTLEKALALGGLSMDDFKARMDTELKIRSLLDSEFRKVPLATEAEAKAFYEDQAEAMTAPESVSARHILVMSDKGEDAKTREKKRAKIEGLREQLRQGADFGQLARESSDCPSGQAGGDLGSFVRGQMVKPFEEAAFTQALHAVGPVVETDFGYHLIQVTDRKTGGRRPFDEVKGEILEHLNRLHRQEVFHAIIDALQAKATVLMDPSVQKDMTEETD